MSGLEPFRRRLDGLDDEAFLELTAEPIDTSNDDTGHDDTALAPLNVRS